METEAVDRPRPPEPAVPPEKPAPPEEPEPAADEAAAEPEQEVVTDDSLGNELDFFA